MDVYFVRAIIATRLTIVFFVFSVTAFFKKKKKTTSSSGLKKLEKSVLQEARTEKNLYELY